METADNPNTRVETLQSFFAHSNAWLPCLQYQSLQRTTMIETGSYNKQASLVMPNSYPRDGFAFIRIN